MNAHFYNGFWYWCSPPRLLMLLFVLLGSLGLQSLSAQTAVAEDILLLENKPSAHIEFRLINNLILIPVMLDNSIPLQFILDTGVRTPILTDRLYSDFLNINYDRTLSLKGAGQEAIAQAYLASNVNMGLPNVQVNNQRMLVLEEDYLELSSQLGVPVHGILGYELFERFVVKIDYEKKLLTLYEPAKFKAPRGFRKLDLSLEDYKPFIKAQVTDDKGKKHELKLLLDTGASHALLLHIRKSNTIVPLPKKTLYGFLGRGLLGYMRGHIGRLPELNLAGFEFEEVVTSFPEEASYALGNSDQERDGTLGGEILSRFSVIVDYPHGAMYLQKSGTFKEDFIYSKTGMVITAKGKHLNIMEVTELRENSPADDAGVYRYDVLYKINGIRADQVSMSKVYEIFRGRNGKRVNMVLLRNGEKVKIRFRLQDII